MNSADLYRNGFVLDCNALESIGFQFDDASRFQALAGSGVTALKSTLGGANGTFEEAVADIAAAQALIEAHPESFIKVRKYADLERAKAENRLAVIFSFEAASMLADKPERIDLFRNRVSEAGLLDIAQMDAIDAEIKRAIESAVVEAKAAAVPGPADLLTDVYVSY